MLLLIIPCFDDYVIILTPPYDCGKRGGEKKPGFKGVYCLNELISVRVVYLSLLPNK